MATRLFRIDTGINGGELVIGTVNEDFVKHFIDEDESDLIDAIYNAEHDPEEYDGPEICEDFYSWSECDDLEHLYCSYGDTEWSWVEVPVDATPGTRDSMENEYEGEEFEPNHLYDREAYHSSNEGEKEKGYEVVPCLAYHTGEKGGMGCWFVETDGEDFDPKKVVYSTVASNVAEIIEDVWYDREKLELNQDWCDTRSKGDWVQVGWFNKDWHDTLEKQEQNMDEHWDSHEDWLDWQREQEEADKAEKTEKSLEPA